MVFFAFVYNLSTSQTTKLLEKIWNVGRVVQLRIPAGRINFFLLLFIRYQGAVRTSLTFVWLCQKSRQVFPPPNFEFAAVIAYALEHTIIFDNHKFQSRWKFPGPFRGKVILNYWEVNGCLGVILLVLFSFFYSFFKPFSFRSCIEVELSNFSR